MKSIVKKVFVFTGILILLFCSSVYASGNSPPTSSVTLPYYTSRTTIYDYVYTAKKFKPNSSGKIYTCFSGTCSSSSPATTINWNLEVNHTCNLAWSYSLIGSTFSYLPQKCISGLNTSFYYHGVIYKNNPTIALTFKWGFGKTSSEASSYSF